MNVGMYQRGVDTIRHSLEKNMPTLNTKIIYGRTVMVYGRNGEVKQTGIDVNPIGNDYVNVWAVNSKGQISTSVMLQIPAESIDAVIELLQRAKDEMGVKVT